MAANRSRLDNLDTVANAAFVALVVSFILLYATHHLAINRMTFGGGYCHNYGLIHLVTGNDTC